MPYSGCNRICSNELHDGRQHEKENGRVPDALEEMSSEAVEYVRGIPVVKTFWTVSIFVQEIQGFYQEI